METNIDFVNKDIEPLRSDFLDRFMVGKGVGPGHSKHAGKITDINIWDYARTKTELIKWTSCR